MLNMANPQVTTPQIRAQFSTLPHVLLPTKHMQHTKVVVVRLTKRPQRVSKKLFTIPTHPSIVIRHLWPKWTGKKEPAFTKLPTLVTQE